MLKDISLAVEPGEFVAILGFSGTGKTTLINLVAGLDAPDAGAVRFKGAPVTAPSPERALVFQSYALMPWLTVADNIGLAVDAVHKGMPRAERAAVTDRYIAMVGLAHARDRRPAELSGGMRQRVAVARALAMEPEMLLMDEPLSALDALTRANLADEIERIWEAERRTVLMITNDVDEALILADRVLILNPDGTMGPDVAVGLPRPRDRMALNENPVFKALRAEITQYLMDVGIAARALGAPAAGRHPAPRAALGLRQGVAGHDRGPLPAVLTAPQGLCHPQGRADRRPRLQPHDAPRRVRLGHRPLGLRQVDRAHDGRGPQRHLLAAPSCSTAGTSRAPTPSAPWCSSRRT